MGYSKPRLFILIISISFLFQNCGPKKSSVQNSSIEEQTPTEVQIQEPLDNTDNNSLVASTQIEEFYRQYLGREADTQGLDHWLAQLQDSLMTLEEIETAIANSLEAIIRGFYLQHLNREPDSTGLSNWAQQVIDGNLTVEQVEQAILNSPEYRNAPRFFTQEI